MSVYVKDLVKDLNLEVLISEQALDKTIDSDLLARPGVELAGFFDFMIQIELYYLVQKRQVSCNFSMKKR